jgi:hypothetical protein
MSRGYGMLEKATASGNAEERGSSFAPHRKVADFQRVLTERYVVKDLNRRAR